MRLWKKFIKFLTFRNNYYMKEKNKGAKKTGQSKIMTFVTFALVGGFLVLVGMIALNRGSLPITTYLGERTTLITKGITNTFTKIITGETNPSSNALFDITVTIPEKYKFIGQSDDISLIVELTNFGEAEKTIVSLSYIITNSQGDLVLIEHEKKIVETQMSYLKTIDLPYLESGKYKLFVELLYSNTSAMANGDFDVL